jgi:hypothetical protein
MLIALIQRPTEVAMGRKTILLDGIQVGYFHGPNKPLILTRHVSAEVAEYVKSEVQKLESCACGKVAVPPETPPEWLEEEEAEESPIILP